MLHQHDLRQADVIRELASGIIGDHPDPDAGHLFMATHFMPLPVLAQHIVLQRQLHCPRIIGSSLVHKVHLDASRPGIQGILVLAGGAETPETVLEPERIHRLGRTQRQGQPVLAQGRLSAGGKLPAGRFIPVRCLFRLPAACVSAV